MYWVMGVSWYLNADMQTWTRSFGLSLTATQLRNAACQTVSGQRGSAPSKAASFRRSDTVSGSGVRCHRDRRDLLRHAAGLYFMSFFSTPTRKHPKKKRSTQPAFEAVQSLKSVSLVRQNLLY